MNNNNGNGDEADVWERMSEWRGFVRRCAVEAMFEKLRENPGLLSEKFLLFGGSVVETRCSVLLSENPRIFCRIMNQEPAFIPWKQYCSAHVRDTDQYRTPFGYACTYGMHWLALDIIQAGHCHPTDTVCHNDVHGDMSATFVYLRSCIIHGGGLYARCFLERFQDDLPPLHAMAEIYTELNNTGHAHNFTEKCNEVKDEIVRYVNWCKDQECAQSTMAWLCERDVLPGQWNKNGLGEVVGQRMLCSYAEHNAALERAENPDITDRCNSHVCVTKKVKM